MTGRRDHPYPSIPAVVFIIWVFVVPILFGDRMLNADGDMLRHLRHGAWMLEHGELLTHDEFSYTRGGDPFVAFEYGSQLLYALAHRVAGLAGVAVLASLLIAGSYALLARFLLSRGADPFVTYLTSIAAAVIGAVHWAARPHLITLFGVTILLSYLESGTRRPPLWRLVPLFLVWANLHGGFVYGLTILGLYLAGSLCEWVLGTDREAWAERVRYYALALLLSGLATLVNPNGPELHWHIVRFFGEPFLRDNTEEFLSPDFHTTAGKMLLASLLAIIGLFAMVPERPTIPRLLLILANVAFVLQARRNMQLFAATVFPILALHADRAVRQLPDWRGIRAVFERDARRGTTLPFIGVAAVLMLILGAAGGRVGELRIIPDRLDPKVFPIAAVQRARADDLNGRVFHEFIWGGYMLYDWPEQRVFIDGGTDFYGPALMKTFMETRGLRPGWRETLAQWNVEHVLVKPGASIAAELVQDGGWLVHYCDGTAALVTRGEAAASIQAELSRLKACAGD